MVTIEGSTKIVNFMTHGSGVLVLRCGHICHIEKMHHFFKKKSYLIPDTDETN